MIFKEVRWVHSNKFCPSLKKEALEWYRPFKYVPCFLQKFFMSLKQRLHRIPVIVQVVENQRNGFSIKALADELGCRIKRQLPLINAFSTNVNAKSLESLAQSQHVKRIWYDREVKAFLDVASPTVHADKLWPGNITGKGVVVAVIDTGIYDHPDLAGRIIAFHDLVNQKTEPYDDNGREKSNFRYRAPAPEAGLVGVKVLNKMGSGSLSTVIEGIQWCVQNKDSLGIRVINMSLGSDTNQSYADDPACQAVEEAWRSGIVVCAAAGNSGPEAGSIGSPAIDPEIITVGAVDDMDTLNAEDPKMVS